MARLQALELDSFLPSLTQPFLGICLGMQLMCAHSEEGDTPALGIVPNNVLRFPATDKVPHMGWNSITNLSGPLFKGIDEGAFVYFVHSYYVEQQANTAANCDYITPFSAAITHNNFHAVQFHPEKSGEIGAQILKNFLEL
jgi:glutamine amidotransferase